MYLGKCHWKFHAEWSDLFDFQRLFFHSVFLLGMYWIVLTEGSGKGPKEFTCKQLGKISLLSENCTTLKSLSLSFSTLCSKLSKQQIRDTNPISIFCLFVFAFYFLLKCHTKWLILILVVAEFRYISFKKTEDCENPINVSFYKSHS
jgi:hypothetical protein